MLQKIALLVASLVATLVIAGGLALSGFGPAQPAADAVQVVDAVAGPSDGAAPDPAIQVDTIYLTPQATPELIDVTQVKEASHREDEDSNDGEHEGVEDHDD